MVRGGVRTTAGCRDAITACVGGMGDMGHVVAGACRYVPVTAGNLPAWHPPRPATSPPGRPADCPPSRFAPPTLQLPLLPRGFGHIHPSLPRPAHPHAHPSTHPHAPTPPRTHPGCRGGSQCRTRAPACPGDHDDDARAQAGCQQVRQRSSGNARGRGRGARAACPALPRRSWPFAPAVTGPSPSILEHPSLPRPVRAPPPSLRQPPAASPQHPPPAPRDSRAQPHLPWVLVPQSRTPQSYPTPSASRAQPASPSQHPAPTSRLALRPPSPTPAPGCYQPGPGDAFTSLTITNVTPPPSLPPPTRPPAR